MAIKIEIIGQISFDKANEMQLNIKRDVISGMEHGVILMLEHNPAVITLGRNAKQHSLLVSEQEAQSLGYDVRYASRGGDVTVHEPGQLVVYFILPVKSKDVNSLIRYAINPVLKFLNEDLSLPSFYNQDKPGVWSGNKKICSLGFDLSGGVSMHGLALNVCNTLEGFTLVNPCGSADTSMSSISELCGQTVDINFCAERLSDYYTSQISHLFRTPLVQ